MTAARIHPESCLHDSKICVVVPLTLTPENRLPGDCLMNISIASQADLHPSVPSAGNLSTVTLIKSYKSLNTHGRKMKLELFHVQTCYITRIVHPCSCFLFHMSPLQTEGDRPDVVDEVESLFILQYVGGYIFPK